LLLLLLCSVVVCIVNAAYYIHFTDAHTDLRYSEGAPVNCPSSKLGLTCCHENDIGDGQAGMYGEVLCDSSIALVRDFFSEMQKLYPNPDFIAFTGDTVSHNVATTIDPLIIETWTAIYDAITASYPNVPIYSALGNHDTYPIDLLRPDGEEEIVWKTAQLWATAMNDSQAIETAQTYGYYWTVPPTRPNMRIVVLNWMYISPHNVLVENDDPDPAGQKAWLRQTLLDAVALGQTPIIFCHSAPDEKSKSNFTEFYTELFEEIAQIAAETGMPTPAKQHGGHTHKDELQFYSPSLDSQSANSVMHVLPLTSGYDGDWPTIAVYLYDETTMQDIDTMVYHVNITLANEQRKVTPELFYSARDAYGIPDTSLKSWESVLERILTDEATAQLYVYLRETNPSNEKEPCGKRCRINLYCDLKFATTTLRDDCKAALT